MAKRISSLSSQINQNSIKIRKCESQESTKGRTMSRKRSASSANPKRSASGNASTRKRGGARHKSVPSRHKSSLDLKRDAMDEKRPARKTSRSKSLSSPRKKRSTPRNRSQNREPSSSPPSSSSQKSTSSKRDERKNSNASSSSRLEQIRQRISKRTKQKREKPDEARKHVLRFGNRKFTVLAPSEIKVDPRTKPNAVLELNYAHGYNGREAKVRNNLGKYQSKLVFNIAGAVVVHDIQINKQKFFLEHTEDVTACTVHPTLPLAASGQQDEKGAREPRICLFDINTLELINEFEGYHYGAVHHLAFSLTSSLLYSCAGDEENTLVVFDMNDENKRETRDLFSMPVAKSEIYGLVIGTNHGDDNPLLVDEFITYGKKHLKSWTVVKDPNNSASSIGRGASKFFIKGHLVPTTSKKLNISEKTYQSVISFPNHPHVFLVGGSTGTIYVIQSHKVKKRLNAYDNSVACLVATKNGFISSSFQGEWTMWTFTEEQHFAPICTGHFKIKSLNGCGRAMAMQWDQITQTLYVGTRRCQIFSYNLTDVDNPEGKMLLYGHSDNVWALASHPMENVFVTSGHDGLIHCWDIDTNTAMPDKTMHISNEQISCCGWSGDGNLIAFGTESSKIYLLDYNTFELCCEVFIPPKSKNSELEQIGILVFNPQVTVLACGHFDGSIYLFDVVRLDDDEPCTLAKWPHLLYVTAACTHIQFSSDGSFMKTFGRDYYLQTWEMNNAKHKATAYTFLIDPDKVSFVGKPPIAGWDVQGILQKGFDGTDINTCAVSKHDSAEERLLVCGDDFGKVWLHKYPAIEAESSREYPGHSAFVVDVEFAFDDQTVMSIGGGDCAVFVWKRLEPPEDDLGIMPNRRKGSMADRIKILRDFSSVSNITESESNSGIVE